MPVTEAAIALLAGVALVLLLMWAGHRRLNRIDMLNELMREQAMSRGYKHYVRMGYDGGHFEATIVE